MNTFHWTDIISLNSSQNDAFEELLCQLAKKEDIQNKKKFIKVGNPDGGVECYVILNNDDEIGFQAKWFLSTPQDTQWNQVEHSFKTTLIKHPKMVTYYVAIPQDRADPRIPKRISFMDKWNEKVKKWKKFAKDTYDRDIEFEYWGSSELITRLGKDENVGLKSFFFGDIDLSNDWFENQNKLAIADLDKRYTPEINVELDILETFDALSRNERFKHKVDNYYHEFMVSYRNFLEHLHEKNEQIESLETPLTDKINALEALYELIIFDGIAYIEFNQIEELLKEIGNISYDLSDVLDEINQKEIEEKKIKTSSHGYRTSTKYDSYVRDFRHYLSNLYQFKEIINSRTLMFANNPFMILDGEAGIGKSHLLADIVNERIKENSNSIFLLGQQFREDKNPWSQIFDLLQLKCNKEEFLGSLNAKAESQNKRLIIFIDAINEGKGRGFWNEFLIGFIESIKQYEWLGLVLSIRSSYFDLIVPKKIFEKGLAIPITHLGFEGVEYNASKIFFKNYNILQPSIPLLHPEFSNPLFLKLFCEGLNKKRLTHIPDGYVGITNIIRFFIEGIEEKLLKKYPNIKSLGLINKTIKVLIPKILENQTITYEDALSAIIKEVTSKWGIASEFLDDLIIEGLFIKNIFYKHHASEYEEGIYFAYERFEDHLKVNYLFDNYLDKENPKESFQKKPLFTYCEENNQFFNRGIIDAMCIQLPERSSLELIDVVDQNEGIIDSFLNSLVWRKFDSITPNVVDRIMKNIYNKHFQEDIYKILFATASNPQHPLNANLLFDYLSKFTMKDRDVFLIPLLNNIYTNYETNPIKRLIDWAWSDEDKSYISDDSIFLTSLTLSWLLTSSNRQLRDYATKALISLLQNRVAVVLSLIKKFENIDEPYIYERLFAVSFGVVIRLENYTSLKELGEYIYNTIFNKGEVYPHILLRDYAKNTIDYISYLGITLDIDFDKTIPPYNSEFPPIDELPKKEDIETYQDRDKNYHQSRIISSMMTDHEYRSGYGDFGRYIFQSKLYDFECKEYAQLISNYATKKIFEEYGYNGDFFNDAEKAISSMNRGYDRHNHSTERIGKKYQWIAFYDTLARITDNFKMYDSSSWRNKKEIRYQGAFEPCVRDIDPTILIKETKVDRKSNKPFWWTPKVNIDWNMDNTIWINHTTDLPSPENILNVIDENNEEWIVLNSFPDWDEPLKKGYDKYKVIHKGLWYQFRNYLVPKEELSDFKLWADEQWFWEDWMPREEGHYQMLNREHYWSEAYKFFQNPYYGGHKDWTEIESEHGKGKKRYSNKIALTTDKYYWEDEFDYSKEGSFSILKPSKILFDGLNMRYSKKDGEFIDETNNLICFEASIDNETHQCLLIQKENLLKFLNDNDLTIVWTMIGEKQIHTPHYGTDDDFFGLMEISGYTYLDNEKIEHGKIKIKNMDGNHKENFIDINLTAEKYITNPRSKHIASLK